MDISALLPQFGNVFFVIAAFVVALSVIVAIHEYGHYIVGRWCGIKAQVFSLGFGPVLWSRDDKHGTKWQIAAFPLGGYVKFLGDSDAAGSGVDGEAVAELTPEEMRHTMTGAPLWARALTVLAGPVFNFVLSILIFSAVLMVSGKVAEPITVGEISPLPPTTQELQQGDVVLAIAGLDLPPLGDTAAKDAFDIALPSEAVLPYKVERKGAVIEVLGPYPYPALVSQIAPQSTAYGIGLKLGDVITQIDGAPIVAFTQMKQRVESSNGKPLQTKVWRDGQMLDFTLVPRSVDVPQDEGGFKTYWRIGVGGSLFFEPGTEAVGIGESLSKGVRQTGTIITGSLSGLYHMITGAISSCNMSGPLGIAQVSGAMASQGAQSFIWFIAVLSTAVGLLNLFPVPMLDGGHLVFYAYEAVSGRKPNDKVLRVLMTIGICLILSLMLFALSNDLFCP